MKRSFLTLVFISFILTSCQKEKLPKLTQEGKNTFGCKINGKNWMPHGRGGLLNSVPALSGGFFQNANTIYIDAVDDEVEIELYVKGVFNTGTYLLDSNTIPRPDNLYPKNYGLYTSATGSSITTSQYTGNVTISNRDTVNKVVSGTFAFTAVNNNGQTVKITDGRFDIKSH